MGTHHIQTDMPYLLLSPQFQERVTKHRDGLMGRSAARKRRRKIQNAQRNGDELKEELDLDLDPVTKASVPEILYDDFNLSPLQMLEILKENFDDAPLCVLESIVQFAAITVLTGDNLDDHRIVFQKCHGFDAGIHDTNVLEIVMRECIDCSLCCTNIGRMIRLYDSKEIQIKCNGECTSYRVEKCSGVQIEALDTKTKTAFMTIYSSSLRYQMVDADDTGKSKKCILKSDHEDGNDYDDGAKKKKKKKERQSIRDRPTLNFGDNYFCDVSVFGTRNVPGKFVSRPLSIRRGASLPDYE